MSTNVKFTGEKINAGTEEEKYVVTLKHKNDGEKLNFYSCKILFKTPQYQAHIHHEEFEFVYESPTSKHISRHTTTIYGEKIRMNLDISSLKINQQNVEYKMDFIPVQKNGIVVFTIPQVISKQFLG